MGGAVLKNPFYTKRTKTKKEKYWENARKIEKLQKENDLLKQDIIEHDHSGLDGNCNGNCRTVYTSAFTVTTSTSWSSSD